MPKINNKHYRNFLDNGIIDILSLDDIKHAVNNCNGIRGRYVTEGKCLIIMLYYTGARPIEVLNIKGKDIVKEKSYVKIRVLPAKRGLPRTLFFPYRFSLIKFLYQYATAIYPDMYLFFNYRSKYKRLHKTKTGEIKEYIEITKKVEYFIKKWFEPIVSDTITPYFLRHSRFSQLSEAGLTPQELQMMKGAKSVNSVQPYLHLSTRTAQNIAKKIK